MDCDMFVTDFDVPLQTIVEDASLLAQKKTPFQLTQTRVNQMSHSIIQTRVCNSYKTSIMTLSWTPLAALPPPPPPLITAPLTLLQVFAASGASMFTGCGNLAPPGTLDRRSTDPDLILSEDSHMVNSAVGL
eukprot:GHVQ01040662.1.p2 GENE.GHVQ01040662.1~~GHVQ01040662.1.p2  ORF type:complete len:132 (+),score=24.15 GHVQ01040662.1:224-619(+)